MFGGGMAVSDPFQVVRDFEADLCAYTGAPYAVAVNSCTMAILLACAWMRRGWPYLEVFDVSLPRLTYVGVPYAVKEAGFEIQWRDEDWQGEYRIEPLPVWDAARRFTSGMFSRCDGGWMEREGEPFQCVSFHHTKILGHSQGGAILHNDEEADAWLRRARFDGRGEGIAASEDAFTHRRAWHCYISPDVAAALRWKLASLPRNNPDLPRSDYPDLSRFPVFTA
jgi:dTDP-4-amino-4,6-dideoxygalactose transaminase